MPNLSIKPGQKPARRLCSATACLLALLVAAGGHWYVLQSIAWVRMFAHYARQDSLVVALVETFDGHHPCKLCLQIQQDRQQEARTGAHLPWLKPEKMPELFCHTRPVIVPPPPAIAAAVPVPRLDFFYDFTEPPPTPPPRSAVAAL